MPHSDEQLIERWRVGGDEQALAELADHYLGQFYATSRAMALSSSQALTSDAETTIAIDLAEQIASKSGLQEASRKLVERLVPVLAK